jgi:hypothetical protein
VTILLETKNGNFTNDFYKNIFSITLPITSRVSRDPRAPTEPAVKIGKNSLLAKLFAV